MAQDKQVTSDVADYRKTIPPSAYTMVDSPTPSNPFAGIFGPTRVLAQQYEDGIQQIQNESYVYGWSQAGRPGFNDKVGFWEVSLVNWVMQNHADFCGEFDIPKIQSFLSQKNAMINQAKPNRFSL